MDMGLEPMECKIHGPLVPRQALHHHSLTQFLFFLSRVLITVYYLLTGVLVIYLFFLLFLRSSIENRDFVFSFFFWPSGMWNSLAKDRTCVPSVEVQSLNHLTTRERGQGSCNIIYSYHYIPST